MKSTIQFQTKGIASYYWKKGCGLKVTYEDGMCYYIIAQDGETGLGAFIAINSRYIGHDMPAGTAILN